jgi:hypothetical protein
VWAPFAQTGVPFLPVSLPASWFEVALWLVLPTIFGARWLWDVVSWEISAWWGRRAYERRERDALLAAFQREVGPDG